MISLETLQLCRQILGTTTWQVDAETIEKVAVQVATARRELDDAIADRGRDADV